MFKLNEFFLHASPNLSLFVFLFYIKNENLKRYKLSLYIDFFFPSYIITKKQARESGFLASSYIFPFPNTFLIQMEHS